MCELLGVCFNKEGSFRLSFSGLKAGSKENPDGWGVAWYDEYGSQVIKESRPAFRSRLAEEFQKHLDARSRIFVSHIRRATRGKVGYINTHPFYRRFDEKTWVFAHNGTIDTRQLSFPSSKFTPIGETDSELVFCSLLSWLGHQGIHLAESNDFVLLHEKLRDINRLGKLNLIISDGRYLFAYHDRNGYLGLHFLLREAPYKVVKLRGQYLEIDLAKVRNPDEWVYIVASKPLSNENWNRFEPGQLMIFSQGSSIFNSAGE